MNERTLIDLEFKTIFEQLSLLCLSEEGKNALLKQSFITEREKLLTKQALVAALINLFNYDVVKPYSFVSIDGVLDKLEINEYRLAGLQLYNLGRYLEAAEVFTNFCRFEINEETTLSATLFESFDNSLKELSKELLFTLEEEGSVKPTHPAIARLVKVLEKERTERQNYSSRFLNENKELATGDQPVYRNERVMLPLKSDRRSAVAGFIHSHSSSGNTIFMEPYQLVELNNRVMYAQQQIELEVIKILEQLSKKVQNLKEPIYRLVENVAYADSLYARARYAKLNNSIASEITNTRNLKLVEARHPLLTEKAVPISINIDNEIKGIVISGPNAGGKTVTLKTVGLFVLMNQFFYCVPAKEGTTLPLFKTVYTEIGDDQSIENSLSTFSAHMKNISSILANCDKDSLLLFDELGSATDPIEGSALGRSILEYCIEKNSLTLITSHHNSLKEFAYANKELLNASMEFDSKTHEPTFKIIANLPGSSYALETAKRMHMPQEVLTRAEKLIGSKAVEVSSIIKNLESEKREIAKKGEQLKKSENLIKERQRELDLKLLQVKQHERLVRENQIGSLNKFIAEKRSELENLVASLREGEINRNKTKNVKKYLDSLDAKKIEKLKEIDNLKLTDEVEDDFSPLKEGEHVLVLKHKKEGEVVRVEKDGSYLVAIGTMKLNFKRKDLKSSKKRENKVAVSYQSSSVTPKTTIDVRGFILEEALEEVKIQLENCLVHSIATFAIIHGRGDGILARGINDYLRGERAVKNYYFARPEDGGHGKTYVEL
jgi:DNA mismatch repair protein MutS2